MTEDRGSAQTSAVLPTPFALIAICPILVFCLAEVILATLAHNAVPFSRDLLQGRPFAEAGEAAARLYMLGLALLVLLGAAGMVLKASFDFFTYFSGSARNTLVLACVLALVVGALFLVLMAGLEFMKPPGRLGDALFAKVFEGVAAIEKPGLWSRDTYRMVTGATHVAVVLAIASMITGSISCMATFPKLDEKENWKFQSQRLKTYATISAAFLIVSVFYFKSWADYPSFLLATEATKEAHAQFVALANAYTAFTGIEYSLVLAAYILPVSYSLSRQADRLARRQVKGDDRPETAAETAAIAVQVKSYRQRQGLQTTSLEMFKMVLAIISPLITGAMANLAAVIT